MLAKEIKIHYSEAVFQKIANDLGKNIVLKKAFKSWLRTDKSPSATIYPNPDGWVYIDFSGFSYDCIALWAMARWGTVNDATNADAIAEINAHLAGESCNIKPAQYIAPPPPQPPKIVPSSHLRASCNPTQYQNNNLVKWLVSLLGEAKAYEACQRYNVGTAKDGAAVFWYVDRAGDARTAKSIQYQPNGKRVDNGAVYHYTSEQGYRLCLFGEHLLTDGQTVGLVESEKTALVCSIMYPESCWIATGGATMLNSEKAQALKNYGVILCYDADDAGRRATQKAQTIFANLGIKSSYKDYFPNKTDGYDLADYVGDLLAEQQAEHTQPEHHTPQQAEPEHHTPQPQHLPTLPAELAAHPQLAQLIKALDLELVNTREHS